MNPTMVPKNMRYRGPVESVKVNDTKLGLFQDLHRLYTSLAGQKERLGTLAQELVQGQTYDPTIAVASAGGRTELPSLDGTLGLGRRLGQTETRIKAGGASRV